MRDAEKSASFPRVMAPLRFLALPIVSLLLVACPAPNESPAPEPPRAAAPGATVAPVAVAATQQTAPGACGDKAAGCGGGCEGKCGGACAGEKKAGGCGCGGGKVQAAAGNVVPAMEAKVGDLTKCPVSGGVFQVNEQTVWVKHDGKTLPVCCAGCAARFNADPSKFLDV